jgi:hypothetical protein
VNSYLRATKDLLLPDPRPGPVPLRAHYVIGREQARGVEWSARRLGHRTTLGANYSWSVARTSAAGLAFPSSADRRHSVDGSLSAALTRRLTFSAAGTWMSGSPFTRTIEGVIVRDNATGLDSWGQMPVAGEPNQTRAPAYSSVDLLLSRRFGGTRRMWDAYLQLRNALNHRNLDPFSGRVVCELESATVCPGLTSGLPRLPAIGVRAIF